MEPTQHPAGATQALVSFAVETAFDQLPPEIIAATKLSLLDQLACALAGGSVEKGRIAVEFARDQSGVPEASILGHRGKVSATQAAFANGELINALDWDPIPHFYPPLIASALASAERAHASGKELIAAIAVGYEIASRLAEVLPGELNPLPHGYGSSVFGCVAGAGRLLRLGQMRMANAFGIAGFTAPIPAMTRWEGADAGLAMSKYALLGGIAQSGVAAALLAGFGYTGDRNILDGPEGFWRLYGGDAARWKPEQLTAGLGEIWRARIAWHKRQPTEVLIGIAVSHLEQIMSDNELAGEDIEHIRFATMPILINDCHLTTVLDSHIDAQFSAPYGLAAGAYRIEPGAAWQRREVMHDPRIQQLMKKIEVVVHPAFAAPDSMTKIGSMGDIPCSVEVTAHGKRFSVDHVSQFPMSETELVQKFRRAASERILSENSERAWHLIRELEALDDVNRLTDCLTP